MPDTFRIMAIGAIFVAAGVAMLGHWQAAYAIAVTAYALRCAAGWAQGD